MTHIKKVSMMRNDKHITKQKFPRLSNLHIIWVWTKRLTLVGLLVVMGYAVVNSGVGIVLAVTVGFLLIRSLIRLAFRLIVTVVYIILTVLILGLIIL
ncbi:hypothetical protein DW701_17465 [Bacteroides eggerthii]|uniref:Uncharacterized protein n=1 Tax=Bacteroides eggerthii TaxID=28111 RepID=A0A414M1F2_9BACE|nr:hypothetical protein DW701_17465 [Bacteroides eggerthii]